MAKFITKGKGKNRKSFPINNRKKGVSVRSVSLEPKAILKINKEQVKSINRGETANFSKTLNQIVIRAKRDGIPIYDTHVNVNNRRKPYFMWIVKHPEKHDKVKGSETIVMADDYGQAIDDFITTWNNDPKRNKKTIGYPVVQGTAKKDFRYARDGHEVITQIPKFAIKEFDDSGIKDLEVTEYNPKWKLFSAFDENGNEFFIFPDEESAIEFGKQSIRDTASEYIPDKGSPNYDEWKNLSEDELLDKVLEVQSDYGQRSTLGAVAQSVAGYDGQYTETSSGWIAFQTGG